MLAGVSVSCDGNKWREAEALYSLLKSGYHVWYKGRENPEIFSELEVYRRQIEYLKGVIVIS